MKYSEREVLQFVEENDVKFIRLTFCDIFGTIKNISIMAGELTNAFEQGIPFDSYAIKGFSSDGESELLLFPDASTLAVLPWRPQQGRVARFYCNICHMDKTPFECDGRYILKNAMEKAQSAGYSLKIGSECEFYLFETDEKGFPTKKPHDEGGYCDIAPADLGENVRRDICLTLEEMGIQPESSHHEKGPGQNEIDFKYSSPLEAADNLLTFKSVVKNISARNGLYASFMPKPFGGRSGSGLHINLSIYKENDTFKETAGLEETSSFAAGILNRSRETTLFFNSTTNSYRRLGKGEAPRYVSWSQTSRSQFMKITQNGENKKIVLRSPDPACNPYLSFALLIYAGLEGIEKGMTLPEPCNSNILTEDADKISGMRLLPETLGEAILIAASSEFITNSLEKRIRDCFVSEKNEEWKEYNNSDDKDIFENNRYFVHI